MKEWRGTPVCGFDCELVKGDRLGSDPRSGGLGRHLPSICSLKLGLHGKYALKMEVESLFMQVQLWCLSFQFSVERRQNLPEYLKMRDGQSGVKVRVSWMGCEKSGGPLSRALSRFLV